MAISTFDSCTIYLLVIAMAKFDSINIGQSNSPNSQRICHCISSSTLSLVSFSFSIALTLLKTQFCRVLFLHFACIFASLQTWSPKVGFPSLAFLSSRLRPAEYVLCSRTHVRLSLVQSLRCFSFVGYKTFLCSDFTL